MATLSNRARKGWWLSTILFFAFSTAQASTPEQAVNQLSDAEREAGWELLFNGKDLSGWQHFGADEAGSRTWQANANTLHFDPGSLGAISMAVDYLFGGKTGDLVYSAKAYRNFELSLEWKISENGNSGIFYLVDLTNNDGRPNGPEMQVLDNAGHPDGEIVSHRAGDLYDIQASSTDTSKLPGEWNQVLIRKQGEKVEHWQNGVNVVSYEYGNEAWQKMIANSKYKDREGWGQAEQGYFLLQDHGDEVWYRNIKARELPANCEHCEH